MRDFPLFTTAYGVASLTLSQIPYTQKAYIRLQDTLDPELLLKECFDFCCAVGAEMILATGHPVCELFPKYTDVIRMQADKCALGETDAMLFPVTEETVNRWQDIYNQKVIHVPNGAWMDTKNMKDEMQGSACYFVHKNGSLVGIGSVSGQQIRWIASVAPGAGKDVVRALAYAITADTVFLEVASANSKAVALYQALGFVATACVSSWYRMNKKIETLSRKNT